MAGILDSKQRIMDILITQNGRRQIADNSFEIRYASFSDHGVFYQDDGTGVADNAQDRIHFEAYASNTDVIIPEINDTNSITINTSIGNQLSNGRFYTSGSTALNTSTIKTGSLNIFSSSAEVIKTAIDNFDQLQIIGSNDGFADEKYFRVSKKELNFSLPQGGIQKRVDKLPPVFADESLASQDNLRYMPPVYLDGNLELPMASYPKLHKEPHNTIDSVLKDLYSDTQSESFKIECDGSADILCQVFENDEKEIRKLTIVDYGSYYDSEGNFLGQLYHLGKLYRDNSNTLKFVRIMCILFE